jgi:transcriptional regulator with PAS, ATPase and Fis domain
LEHAIDDIGFAPRLNNAEPRHNRPLIEDRAVKDLPTHIGFDLATENERLGRLNQQLSRTNENLVGVLNTLPAGVITVNAEERVILLNLMAEQLLRLPREAILNRRWDQVLPIGEQSIELLRRLSELPLDQRSKLPVQILTDDQHKWVEIEARENPASPGEKIFLLNKAADLFNFRSPVDRKAQFQGLIGQSPAMQLLFNRIVTLAKVDVTVLIEGETGTGKEMLARAIHQCSLRRNKPFIAFNCAGLTESLLTSQLFGHRRGAFTGAVSNNTGLFEAANGGTLLLDEIGDMPMSVQTALLRVLQEKEITRLGESIPRKVDVRIISATHRDLNELVSRGAFRQDLLYRIRVATVSLPPLRHHRQDIPLLVAWFLEQSCKAMGKQVPDISGEAMNALMEYPWKGNVRELKNVIEVAVSYCDRPVINLNDLPPEIRTDWPALPPRRWDQEEKGRILHALDRTGGNHAAAARLLGIGRTTLYRRIKLLDIKE